MHERFRLLRDRAGIFLDFDGTLSDIAPRPDLARPAPGAVAAVERLTRTYALVAVVSGRTEDQVRQLFPAPGVVVFGLYGLSDAERSPAMAGVREDVQRAASVVRGARVEDKGGSIAVHYRGAKDVDEAERSLAQDMEELAGRHGLTLLRGKMVFELAPAEFPGKGAVILRECRARSLRACLYAGDDLADLAAFEAVDELREEGLVGIKVAVRSAETPDELVTAADDVVEGSAGLVELLFGL